jgi:hypothetical protein
MSFEEGQNLALGAPKAKKTHGGHKKLYNIRVK